MDGVAPRHDAIDDFRAWEERQPERWERLHGVVRMMVGGSAAHNKLTRRLANALERLAPACCGVFAESLKLQIGAHWLYPDVMVVCPQPPGDATYADSAVIVAEVVSSADRLSTRRHKREIYKSLPSVQAVLELSQSEIYVELHRRDGEHWVDSFYEGPDARIDLPGCAAPLDLGALYETIIFPPEPPPPAGLIR